MKKNPTVVLVFGTYDKFHPGHEYFLTEAKKYGDYLVVVIARDKNVEALKSKLPRDDELVRQANVAKFSAVDKTLLGFEDFSQRHLIIDQVKPGIICLGYDQAPDFKSSSPDIKIVRIGSYYPERYKSSLL